MPESQKFARPYAKALFEQAEKSAQIDFYLTCLHKLTELSGHKNLLVFLSEPTTSDVQRLQILKELMNDTWDPLFERFVQLLLRHKRLTVTPTITRLYQDLHLRYQGKLKVQLFTAQALKPDEQEKFYAALERELGSPLVIEHEIDPTLLGGYKIYQGSRLIDGSVLSKLHRLQDQIVP